LKLEEASRNELLAFAKGETITRYNKAQAYKGFSINNIDTTDILKNNVLVVTCQVGDYDDTIGLEDILYWIEMGAESNQNRQINTKVITQAVMNSIDGMDIKVDCTCGDFRYRFAYMATTLDYKYGKPEYRPNRYHKTNKENRGSICKHLVALLSNKRWLQQVTATLMDWCEEHIDEINDYLRLSGDKVLTLPNELARKNAKDRWNRQKEEPQENPENIEEPEQKSDVQGNNPSTNRLNNIGNNEEPESEET